MFRELPTVIYDLLAYKPGEQIQRSRSVEAMRGSGKILVHLHPTCSMLDDQF